MSEAQAELAKWAPTGTPQINIPKLTKAPPKNINYTLITCANSACASLVTGVQEATKLLGWHLRVVNGGLTAQSYISAWKNVDADPGNVVEAIGILPISEYMPEINALPKNVPLVISVPGPNASQYSRIGFFTAPPAELSRNGRLLADWVVADAKGKPVQSVMVEDPTNAGLLPTVSAYDARLKQLCPKCQNTNLQVSASNPAQIPPTVASFLQSHSGTQYVVGELGSMMAGVPERLAGSGIKVKMITRAADQTNFASIKSGQMTAGMTAETTEQGWTAVDGALMLLNKQNIANRAPIGVFHLVTQANLPSDLSQPYIVPNFADVFKKAWGL